MNSKKLQRIFASGDSDQMRNACDELTNMLAKLERDIAMPKAQGPIIVPQSSYHAVEKSHDGPLALADGKPVQPKSVVKYLASKFGENFDDVSDAMLVLAKSLPREALMREAFHLYEKFRPEIPVGVEGWGKMGVPDLSRITKLARKAAP